MRIVKSRQFEKQYRKLPAKLKKQFADRLAMFLENKNHSLLRVHSLSGNFDGLYSFNVSADIRVIFDSSYDGVLILVAIGSHSELYK